MRCMYGSVLALDDVENVPPPEILTPSPSPRPHGEQSTRILPPMPAIPPEFTRFGAPLANKDLEDRCKAVVPMQTRHNNNWATSVFNTWISSRNTVAEETLPADMLQVRYHSQIVDEVLAAFVLEARRADGNYYPGNTILSALFRVMKMNIGPLNIQSFVEKSSREKFYPKLHNALDW